MLRKISDNIFFVDSNTTAGVIYKVQILGSNISCNCRGFSYKRTCSHIDEVKQELDKRVTVKKLEKKDNLQYVARFKQYFTDIKINKTIRR